MTTGVIIGRFQVPELTLGHKALIIKAYEHFDRVGFLLGCTQDRSANRDNPLNFDSRWHMLQEWDPVFTGWVFDSPGDDDEWSRGVDRALAIWGADLDPTTITLVGGRQSFIPHYRGRFPVLEIPVWVGRSGTEVRKAVSEKVVDSPDFRRGVIWAVHNYGL